MNGAVLVRPPGIAARGWPVRPGARPPATPLALALLASDATTSDSLTGAIVAAVKFGV
jgi:hypothetical protein